MSYFDRLEQELTAAAVRHRPRRQLVSHRVLAAAAAVVVVALVAVAWQVSRPRSAYADTVTVQSTSAGVRVTVALRTAPPRAVVKDLRAHGLRADVFDAPTGPSEVGKLIGMSATGPGIVASGRFQVLIPSHWTGSFRVLEGAAAAPGAPYTEPSNAFAAGEPLACLRSGVRVHDLIAVARSHGVTVSWIGLTQTPPDDAAVTEAFATSASSVSAKADTSRVGSSIVCRS